MAEKTAQNGKPKTSVPAKPYLLAPFTTQWPLMSTTLIEEVVRELKLCTSDMNMNKIKLMWEEVKQFEKGERCEGRKKLIEQHLMEMSSEEQQNYNDCISKAAKKWKHLDMGYNSVMRNLMKKLLAGVLVKKNCIPDQLGLTFIPACFAQNIPLIPIDDLDDILKEESNMGVNHSIVALGLKKSILECKESGFQSLHSKMLDAWASRETDETSIFSETIVETTPKVSSSVQIKAKKKKVAKALPKVDLSKYLLPKIEGQEAWNPSPVISRSADFIGVAPSNCDLQVNEKKTLPKEDVVQKMDTEVEVNFEDFFSIDSQGDEENTDVQKPKKKKRKLNTNFLATNVAKIKPNPNKKKRKKM